MSAVLVTGTCRKCGACHNHNSVRKVGLPVFTPVRFWNGFLSVSSSSIFLFEDIQQLARRWSACPEYSLTAEVATTNALADRNAAGRSLTVHVLRDVLWRYLLIRFMMYYDTSGVPDHPEAPAVDFHVFSVADSRWAVEQVIRSFPFDMQVCSPSVCGLPQGSQRCITIDGCEKLRPPCCCHNAAVKHPDSEVPSVLVPAQCRNAPCSHSDPYCVEHSSRASAADELDEGYDSEASCSSDSAKPRGPRPQKKSMAEVMEHTDRSTCNKDILITHTRLGGVGVAIYPCGIAAHFEPIFFHESPSQFTTFLWRYTRNHVLDVVLTTMRATKQFVRNRATTSEPMRHLNRIDRCVDPFHFRGHVDPECRANHDPHTRKQYDLLKRPVCEQYFSWLSRFKKIVRMMSLWDGLFFSLV